VSRFTALPRLTALPRPHPGWIVAGLLALLLGAAVFGDNGVLQLWRLRGEVESLHRDVQGLEAENERLTRAITELRDDPAALERIAREELGLVRPGDRVLRFPRPSSPPRSP
jgi:cell division protein FtsB